MSEKKPPFSSKIEISHKRPTEYLKGKEPVKVDKLKTLCDEIRAMGTIDTSAGPMQAGEILHAISEIYSGRLALSYVTRTNRFRDRLREILIEEGIPFKERGE